MCRCGEFLEWSVLDAETYLRSDNDEVSGVVLLYYWGQEFQLMTFTFKAHESDKNLFSGFSQETAAQILT